MNQLTEKLAGFIFTFMVLHRSAVLIFFLLFLATVGFSAVPPIFLVVSLLFLKVLSVLGFLVITLPRPYMSAFWWFFLCSSGALLFPRDI